jgi:hypothetical protein
LQRDRLGVTSIEQLLRELDGILNLTKKASERALELGPIASLLITANRRLGTRRTGVVPRIIRPPIGYAAPVLS